MHNTLTWKNVIGSEKQANYFKQMMKFISKERKNGKLVFPSDKDVFNAFKFTKFSDVKVVILGQDPYYGKNQAHGLSFSVPPGVNIPPSLINIYQELAQDIKHFQIPKHGFLKNWTKQGVLLLNTILTVEEKKPHSHSNIGWEIFTDKVIQALSEQSQGIIFLLWGNYAKKKGTIIKRDRHYILEAAHPSPLSAHQGFFGCKHFSKTNRLLINQKKQPINWHLPLIT
nr:uracil-DNA glycosylase [Candidatus Photodesmus katoptron]